MNKFSFALTAAVLFLIFSNVAFSQTQTPTPPKPGDTDVVKISTTLIQVDVTVTDKKGNPVTDLKAEDFEILENGEKQNITNFSFVELQPEKTTNPQAGAEKSAKNAVPVPPPPPPVPTRLRPEQVRRTIALVVDDLGASFSSAKWIKDALKKFVDVQMQDGDLVAIVRTSGGMGALQQFTSDKRILYAAIEKLRWNPNGRVGTSSFDPIKPSFKENINAGMNAVTGDQNGKALGTEEDIVFDIGLNEFREDSFSVGTLGAVNYVIRGMRELPGRKALMLFSEGFALMENGSTLVGANPRIEGALKNLTDLANRSSVIIYAVDPRGLVSIQWNAEDSRVGLRADPLAGESSLADRQQKLTNTQQSLQYLTDETGGFAIINNNDINDGIKRVLNDQKAYYLLAYQPDGDTFDPAKRQFNKLTINVKRPGLKVRYRSGFFGVTDPDGLSEPKTPQRKLLDALASPFAAGQISLSLTTLFATDVKGGSFVRALVHVKGSDINFVAEADGWNQAKFEVIAVTFGDNGEIVEMVNRAETIKARAAALKEIRENGLVYSMTVPVKKPGAYQLRIAFRDEATSKIGSANQFIEIPDMKKKRLALSGLVLQSSLAQEKERRGENNLVLSDARRDIAVRRFQAGTRVMFGASVYNLDKLSAKPNLVTQFRIFQDNREIYASPENLLNFNGYQDLQNVDIGGSFDLGRNMSPGDYVLQVIVKDLSPSGNRRIATQWIDFEIIN